MHTTVIIPYLPRDDHSTLCWTLEGFAGQTLVNGHSMDILVGVDGGDGPLEVPLPSFARIAVHHFPHVGAAAVRNALLAKTTAETDLIVFGNADARAEPDMVQRHADSMARLPPRSMVLGAAPWERSDDPSVFDTLIDQAPMIFSYCHMKPHCLYPFRCAYTLNLSVRREDFFSAGGFPEEVRPVFYEDLALGYRVMGPDRDGVLFEPAARVLHRHPLTLDAYLDREELMGIMAPVLARVCPEAFAVLMAHRDVEQIAADFCKRSAADTTVYRQLYGRFRDLEKTSHTTLGVGDERAKKVLNLFKVHIPLKLTAFRRGFLRGMELRDDARWEERRAMGLWREAIL